MSIFGSKNHSKKMSIFGIKKYKTDDDLILLVDDMLNRLQPLTNLATKVDSLEDRIEWNKIKIDHKSKYTICAESKGSLINGKVFSFGNGGREDNVGYNVMYPSRITDMSVSSDRKAGDVKIGVIINGVEKYPEYDITLPFNVVSKEVRFDQYFEVLPGQVINFVSKGNNSTTTNTVACLMLQIE